MALISSFLWLTSRPYSTLKKKKKKLFWAGSQTLTDCLFLGKSSTFRLHYQRIEQNLTCRFGYLRKPLNWICAIAQTFIPFSASCTIVVIMLISTVYWHCLCQNDPCTLNTLYILLLAWLQRAYDPICFVISFSCVCSYTLLYSFSCSVFISFFHFYFLFFALAVSLPASFLPPLMSPAC